VNLTIGTEKTVQSLITLKIKKESGTIGNAGQRKTLSARRTNLHVLKSFALNMILSLAAEWKNLLCKTALDAYCTPVAKWFAQYALLKSVLFQMLSFLANKKNRLSSTLKAVYYILAVRRYAPPVQWRFALP
jgi:hypothetical protein